ncbi:hypothetical protein TPB0596_08110 [Tsukamurella pulmonis]|uniref:Uncharacterized protein n=1 Tax=Tsukamurella pulmonis TaxID=47312 RepID=A0A1H1HD59_9ACTN|nr:hypothetical protein [Tsukamurella pulmonis]BDD81048.1 hypothetical protein TPB0596_08110 [Tsukamurella pulmonis]SDR22976.1 hypothetical protein SAMN04489765_4021 [Tsukamurella pulmonis]SUP15254.1 Uncharacterised protein [Tsukamurella pulmonis]
MSRRIRRAPLPTAASLAKVDAVRVTLSLIPAVLGGFAVERRATAIGKG